MEDRFARHIEDLHRELDRWAAEGHRLACRRQVPSCLASCPALGVCGAALVRLEARFRDQCRGWYFSMPEDRRDEHGRQRILLTHEDHTSLVTRPETLEQQALRRENGRELVAFLEDTLTDRQLFAVVRYYWLGDNDRQIAGVVGISQPGAYGHRRRGLDAIRDALAGAGGPEVINRAVSSTTYWRGWAYEPKPATEARPNRDKERRAALPMDLARRRYRMGSGRYSERGIYRTTHDNRLPEYLEHVWPGQDVQLPLDMMPAGPERAFLAAAVARDQQGKHPRTVTTAREYLEQPCEVHRPGDRSRFITGPLIKREVTFTRWLHLTAVERENLSPTVWRDARRKRRPATIHTRCFREASFFER